MGRGNHVNGIKVIERFGLSICTPTHDWEVFTYYKRIHISNGGILIGTWDRYRDFISYGWFGYQILKKTDKYIFLKRST